MPIELPASARETCYVCGLILKTGDKVYHHRDEFGTDFYSHAPCFEDAFKVVEPPPPPASARKE